MVRLVLGQRGFGTDLAVRSRWCHESDLDRARWFRTGIDDHQHSPRRWHADSSSSGDPGIDAAANSYCGDNTDCYFVYRIRKRNTDVDRWNSDVDRYTGRRDGDSDTCDGIFRYVNCVDVEPSFNGSATIARRYLSSGDVSGNVIATG